MQPEQPPVANHTALWLGAAGLALGTALLTRYVLHRQQIAADRRAGALTVDRIAGPFGMLHRPPEDELRPN